MCSCRDDIYPGLGDEWFFLLWIVGTFPLFGWPTLHSCPMPELVTELKFSVIGLQSKHIPGYGENSDFVLAIRKKMHKLKNVRKLVLATNFKQNNCVQILFQKCKCIHILLLWAKFHWKLLWEKGFSNFGHVTIFMKRKFIFWPPFWKKTFLECSFCWFMFVSGVYRYGASFVLKFRQEILKNGWVQVDPLFCAQTRVKSSSLGTYVLKGHWTSITSSNFFQKKRIRIFIPLEVLAWVMIACWVLRSRLTYFWRNMNISSIFYFSKSTSINTQYSSLWDTLKMMLFTKYLIKWKASAESAENFGIGLI